MPVNFDPTSPIEAYKAMIDQLVEQTTPGVNERRLRESGVYSGSAEDAAANDLVTSLSGQQRDVLAEMLRQERVSAIHDVLAAFTWWLLCREVGLTFRGKPMPFQLSEMGLHGDYIGRLDGWEWPSDDESANRKGSDRG